MKLIKLVWVGRAFLYKLTFKKIGNRTYIGKPCFVEGSKKISVGSRTRIFPGLRAECIGDGLIEIGNNCAIQQNVHIISAGKECEVLKIGDNVTVSANVFITNCNHEYRDVSKSVMEQGLLYGKTEIGEGSFIGFGAAIQCGTVLGKHCVVGSNSVVKGNFPDYSVIVGSPAKVVKKYNPENGEWEKVNN